MRFEKTTFALASLALAGASLASLPATAAAQSVATRTFDGYVPSRCVVAARVIDGLNRHDRRDTTVYSPTRDTLFTATVERLLECEQAYGGTTEDDAERLNAARVQLFTGRDDAAIATTRRHMERFADREVGERAWELLLALNDALAGKPARMEQARAAMEAMDRLGQPAATLRTLAHYLMLRAAVDHLDDDLMRREWTAAVDAWQTLDAEHRLWRSGYVFEAVRARAAAEALFSGGAVATAVIDSARGFFPSERRAVHQYLENFRRMFALIGEPAAPLEAAFWYNTGMTGARRPAPGRVSLILPINRPCTERNRCLYMLDAARRFEREFGDRGLDITFRTRTWGFYADTAPAAPLAEAMYDSAYFVHDLEIPGALAIAETEYSWKPDGRRENHPTTDDVNYRGAGVVIVDRKGIIRYVGQLWDPIYEAPIAELIERLVNEPPGADP